MKHIIRAIKILTVDCIFLLVMLGLLIWFMIDTSQNFTHALILVVGYVFFNIVNKYERSLHP